MHYVFLTFIALVIQETLKRKQNTDKNNERTMANKREPNSSTARNCSGQWMYQKTKRCGISESKKKGSWLKRARES